MKSPLNIAETVKRYNLDAELKKKLIAFDRFIWKDCIIKSVSDLLVYENEYQTRSKDLNFCYDTVEDEFGPINMHNGTMAYLERGSFQSISKCMNDSISRSFQDAGLTVLETIIIRSFLGDISGLYRLDAYHYGVPPFVQSVCKVLNETISKFPAYNDGVVRACVDEDKDVFNVGDIFIPGFCLTTSADLNWKDTSVNRYNIIPRKDDKTKARAIFKVKDNSEKQVTFLQDAQFRIVDVKEWGNGKKEFVMEEFIPIEIDLVTDMANIMRDEMREIGYKVNIPNDREAMIYYFTTCARIVKTKPRKVHEAAGLVVPESRKAGYDALKTRFEKGESVVPHLSKQIKGLKFQDKMLFDWGIHHFHLDDKIEEDGFVKQHDELVYAIVEEDDVYFIDVLEHDHWSDKDLLEKVLSNWPYLLKPYQIGGIPVEDFDSNDIEQLRKSNVNLVLTLSDGHGYMGRGMGMTGAGTSANASIQTIDMANCLKKMEKQIIDNNTNVDGKTLIFTLERENGIIYLKETTTGQKWDAFQFQSLKMKIS